jgi:hypothetical protein
MSLTRSLVFAVFAFLLMPAATAQVVSARGTGTVPIDCSLIGCVFTSDHAAYREAARLASINALENHLAAAGTAKLRLYEKYRAEIDAEIDRYVLSYVKISDHEDKKARTYTINIRAEIDSRLLQAKLDSHSAAATAPAGERSLLTFVFLARAQDSVQAFDDRDYERVEVNSAYGERTKEGESVGRRSVGTSGTQDRSVSVSVEKGGSKTRKRDKITWAVSSANEINTTMTGIFSAAGYEVVEAEYIESESQGLLSIGNIRKDFSTGNDLSAATLRNAANGVRKADIPYLVYGTLDVGMRDRDPVTGLVRIYVTVQGKVLDVRGRFPKTVSSVGPVQYAGLGPDESVARVNALQEAATRAAEQISNELNLKAVR